jgi:hypothetical protein
MSRRFQLRTYEIAPGDLAAFLEVFRAQLVPLRAAHGFRVEGAWVHEARDGFTWLVSHDGPEGFEAAEAAYYAAPERARITPAPGSLIRRADVRTVEPLAPAP